MTKSAGTSAVADTICEKGDVVSYHRKGGNVRGMRGEKCGIKRKQKGGKVRISNANVYTSVHYVLISERLVFSGDFRKYFFRYAQRIFCIQSLAVCVLS